MNKMNEFMRPVVFVAIAAIGAAACAPTADTEVDPLQTWSFEEATMFPADRSLVRPEDGVVLADATMLVADQVHGLVALSPDGSKRPFGHFAEAGYVHEPPSRSAGPNGVSLEPDGANVLVADIFTGAIYRVDIKNETTKRIYMHEFGVNNASSDSSGAVWFTQSTENTGPDSEARLFAAADRPLSDGALFRIAPASTENPQPSAELKVAGLDFANGFVIDEARDALYLAETMGDRVLGFKMSVATGALADRHVVANVLTPDNIEMDGAGQLWVASPIGNEILVINPENGDARSVFHPQSAESDHIIEEWRRRTEAGEPRLALLGPEMWAPMPGLLTGVILTPGGGPVYVSGLGDALMKLDR